MAIDVDWAGTDTNPYRIFVPKADLTLVQASPEIRTLDVDAFRLELKDLEAAEEGMPWSDTHQHTGETQLSGVTYARFIEILAPYSVEFEDGQYVVTTPGANHNIADVKVANQVGIVVQNSAGLVVTPSTVTAGDVWGADVTGYDYPSAGGYIKTILQKIRALFGL